MAGRRWLGCERHLSAILLTLMANAYSRRENRRVDLRLNLSVKSSPGVNTGTSCSM